MLKRIAKRTVRSFFPLPVPNLLGDRDVENAWVAGHMGDGPGEALDFGCGYSYLGLIAANRGYSVTAVDLMDIEWPYEHPRLRFVHGDILKTDWAPESYDLVINCSTIEHVGLAGRYGSGEVTDGDLQAMARLRELMKPGALMIMTLPVGQDAVIQPYHRVYGPDRLPRILEGFEIREEKYCCKPDKRNVWKFTERNIACQTIPSERFYSLGLFVLGRSE